MNVTTPKKVFNPWFWIPSLYLAEGIPYVMVMSVAGIMYKRLGISNTDIALYTSFLYLPWVIKPLWSPVVDLLKTKRWWITTMQSIIGVSLAGLAAVLPNQHFFLYSLLFLWLLAFSSATHDIAADGFYMIGLNPKQQAYFIGIRTTFYRLAMIIGLGLVVMLTGWLEKQYANATAWALTIGAMAIVFIAFYVYHYFLLPYPATDIPTGKQHHLGQEFTATFIRFFKKDHIGQALAFILLFRLAESQLVKLAGPFMLDTKASGGLGLDTTTVGFIYGTVGTIALVIGGIAGGLFIARQGLKFWLLGMTIAMNLPNLVYVYLSCFQPENVLFISSCVAIEQLGYGFGFTAYTFYLIRFSAGEHKTAYYALCTGLMALGMMLPGMISGFIADTFGYRLFFLWVMLCTIPGFLLIRSLHIPEKE